MIQGLIVKLIIKAIMKAINKKHNLNKIDKYVNDDNELDIKVRKIYSRLVDLEKDSHPSQEYICCRKCGCNIAKTKPAKKKRKK
jgi:hypothetical protein